MLTNLTIYWVTETIGSSFRIYYESGSSEIGGASSSSVSRAEVPTAYALFPNELFRPPPEFVDRFYNIVRWTELPSGGHFASLEQPELLARDITEFAAEISAP